MAGLRVQLEKTKVQRSGKLPVSNTERQRQQASVGKDPIRVPQSSAKAPTASNGWEAAYVGLLGMAAGKIALTLSKGMMNIAKDLGPLTVANVAKKQIAGGFVLGLPFALIQDAFVYKKGEVSARRYWGNVIAGSMSFGLWGAGALAASALLPFSGFAAVAAGLAVGSLASSVFDRTLGRAISNTVARSLIDKEAKTGADAIAQYVAEPLARFIGRPIKRHWKMFLATGGVAALYYGTRKGKINSTVIVTGQAKNKTLMSTKTAQAPAPSSDGKAALRGIGALVLSAVPQLIGDHFLTKLAPFKALPGIDLLPGPGQVYQEDNGHVVAKEATASH
ncbi:MAG: hypothetical protein HY692_02195 [Cyanobacteria bacterium NC_groundwater_1444_Ag_S-0.65um_54_12]|nr:hypothetical protein [Cyanobacteria bacterium NC_groundwater_1444_Ag_S-0.65um_54_12]